MPKTARTGSLTTRARILSAARELFAARGFKGTTTAAIARTAGVNEALIFRHFPGKDDLYAAILQAKLGDEQLAGIIDSAGHPDVRAALEQVATRFLESTDPEFLRLYYHSALEGHALAAGFYAQFVRRLISLVEALIRRGVREGRFRRVDASLAAHAFTGMLRSYCLTRELFPSHALTRSDRDVAHAFCEIFLLGITADAGGSRTPKRPRPGANRASSPPEEKEMTSSE